MEKYFFGILSVISRFLTKNSVKRIPTGIPVITTLGVFGIFINQEMVVISKQFRGFTGEIEITGIPSTPIEGNTVAMREAWIGCKPQGFLLSPNVFLAVKESCDEELRKKSKIKYIKFLEKEKASFFLFKNCFRFKRKKIAYSLNCSFGSPLSGIVFKVR